MILLCVSKIIPNVLKFSLVSTLVFNLPLRERSIEQVFEYFKHTRMHTVIHQVENYKENILKIKVNKNKKTNYENVKKHQKVY